MNRTSLLFAALAIVLMMYIFLQDGCPPDPKEESVPGLRFNEEPNQNIVEIAKYLEGVGVEFGYDDSTGAFYYENEIIVNLNRPEFLNAVRRKYGAPVDSAICRCDDSLLLWMFSPDSVQVEEIVKSSSKQTMESDYNFVYYPGLVAKYQIPALQQRPLEGSENITVAILDTGLDTSRQTTYPMWEDGNTRKDSGDCRTDGSKGWNFVSEDGNIDDDHGHGTLVTDDIVESIAAADARSGHQTSFDLMVLKVLDEHGLGDMFHGLCAIRFAIKNGADIINISWGSTLNSTLDVRIDPIYSAICESNKLFVASKGNDKTKTFNHVVSDYPLPNLLAIGGDEREFWSDGSVALFENSNQHPHFLTAPSTRGEVQGTSFSAAKVTGLAAHLMDVYADRDPGFIILKIHELTSPQFDAAGIDYPFKYISLP